MTVYRTKLSDIYLHDAGWLELPSGVRISKLPLLDRAGWQSRGMARGSDTASTWARVRSFRLPDASEYLELHRHPQTLHIAPMTIYVDKSNAGMMSSREWCERHDREVWQRLATAGFTSQPVANFGKHLDAQGDIIGWDLDPGPAVRLIQSESPAHRPPPGTDPAKWPGQADYGSGMHVVDPGTSDRDTKPDVPVPSSPGDRGRAVKDWQLFLMEYFKARGLAALPRYGPDGIHGASPTSETTVWTERWREAQQAPDTEPPLVAPVAHELIRAKNFTPASRTIGDVHLLTMHSIQTKCVAGAARSNALYFAGPNAPNASIHWWHDPATTVQGLEERHLAWGAKSGPERHAQLRAIHVEHAGYTAQPAYRTKAGQLIPAIPQTDWLGPSALPMLERSALQCAASIREWDLLPRYLTDAEMVAWRNAKRRGDEAAAWKLRGINKHRQFTTAYSVVGGHQDPGGWPDEEHLEMIRAHL